MRHEARTSTIHRWTSLSPFSVRTLHEAYCSGHYGPALKRHRGVPPYLMRFFWSSPELRQQAALLAGLCLTSGALPPAPVADARERLPNLVRGEQLCEAYEAFLAFVPNSAITIDHAVLLLTVLAEGQEAALLPCLGCSGMTLIDRLALTEPMCSHCAGENHKSQSTNTRSTRRGEVGKPWRHSVRRS